MKVTGLITEYNPFHNGHAYHLQAAKALTHADYLVVVMSGNFVQRGEPALVDKFARSEMALRCGADLVLELPAIYATGSAEIFASGAVALLDRLGVVDALCFGSESGDLQALQALAEVLVEEPADYQKALKHFLKQGLSFPAARTEALRAALGQQDAVCLLDTPNNILGIEYLKALKKRGSAITPFTIARAVTGYHDTTLTHAISSATAIRRALLAKQDLTLVKNQMPEAAFSILERELRHTAPVTSDHFSSMLRYVLLHTPKEALAGFLDVNEELANRIERLLPEFQSFSQFAALLKNKQLTHTRIQRALLHILLQIRDSDLQRLQSLDYVSCARVLGFRRTAAPLLAAVKSCSDLPLITKPAHAENILQEAALDQLLQDIRISHIYHGAITDQCPEHRYQEYRQPLVIL